MQLEHILATHGLIGGGKGKDNIPPPPITNFQSVVVGQTIKLTWTNPNDTDFIGLLIVGKNGSQPTGVFDGSIILNENIEDGGTVPIELIDSNITLGTRKYYRAFPYDFDKNYQTDTGQQTSAIIKTSQTKPNAPTMASRTSTSITLNVISGCEYRIGSGAWQNSAIFSGLSIATSYTFYARKKETATHYASPASNGAIFTTDKGTQSAPAAPTVSNIEFDRAYVNGGSGTEVRLGTGAWYNSPHTFVGLSAETTYQAYTRRKETNTHYASPISVAKSFKTIAEIKIYGIEIDEANSNPETAVIYTDDAVGFTPASGNNGAFDWGSWESIIKDEFKIRPCVLNNPAKTVNYYLDYDNYNLKATGGASVLTGTDGDVMTEFGADIYTKWTVVGSKHKIQFSIKPFEGATKNAFETENGYNQFLYYPLLLTQKLFQMIFKNRDSQTALGRGYVDGNSAYANTGGTNTKGFMFGETTGKQQMKFLGIEDYWGNKYQWIDGLVTDASYNLLIGNSGFNDSGSGYTNHASGVSANTVGYIDTVQGGNDKGFIIKGKSGGGTTHYCDYGFLHSSRVASFGGHLSNGSDAGFAFLRLSNSASVANATLGSRLFCKNNGKLYIGAYLGTTQGGKLRSVSGTAPSDIKTISAFRNEARANNI